MPDKKETKICREKNKSGGLKDLKYEIAGELGLLDKVKKEGWKALSPKETGRIGGLVTKRKRRGEDKC